MLECSPSSFNRYRSLDRISVLNEFSFIVHFFMLITTSCNPLSQALLYQYLAAANFFAHPRPCCTWYRDSIEPQHFLEWQIFETTLTL